MKTTRNTTSKKASIGDIVEVKTPEGLGYVQYTHEIDPREGELVRVLPGLYAERPSDFAALARLRELYFVFLILNYGLRTGIGQMEIVSNQPVPDWAKPYPMMRHSAGTDGMGKTIRWRIISAASPLTPEVLVRTPLLTHLTPEQKRLSIREIWPPAAMVKNLARGWTLERAEELRLKDVAEARERREKQAAGGGADYKGMRHFLYFPRKRDAEAAGEILHGREFSVEVRESAMGEDWLVLATKSAPATREEMGELRDEMETLAARFGGEYDGWEAAIDSLGSPGSGPSQKVN